MIICDGLEWNRYSRLPLCVQDESTPLRQCDSYTKDPPLLHSAARGRTDCVRVQE